MGAEIRADPTALVRLAESYLDNAKLVSKALNSLKGSATVPATAFGNLRGVAQVYPEYVELLRSGGLAAERFGAVLEVDNDSLMRTAFSYQETDIRAEQMMRRPFGGR